MGAKLALLVLLTIVVVVAARRDLNKHGLVELINRSNFTFKVGVFYGFWFRFG